MYSVGETSPLMLAAIVSEYTSSFSQSCSFYLCSTSLVVISISSIWSSSESFLSERLKSLALLSTWACFESLFDSMSWSVMMIACVV